MKLKTFRILNYRSINDSGEIEVAKITSLVGRNESGKSNLLLALQTLNPAGGVQSLSPIKNFPRHRRLSECSDDTPVVSTLWELDQKEQAELAAIFPRALGVSRVSIDRDYKAIRSARFIDLKPLVFSIDEVEARIRKVRPVIEAEVYKLDAAVQDHVKASIEEWASALVAQTEGPQWADASAPALAKLRQALATFAISLPDREEGLTAELEQLAAQIRKDGPAWQAARSWATQRLPVFIYVDDYPHLNGHQNIAEYLGRKGSNQLGESDRNFEKMCKVADLSPQQLNDLYGANDHETRNQLANRSSAIVTSELRRLWKDRSLKVRFSPDAHHLNTFISDPNSVYDVEVNLNERSRGLKWFFSFYITFSADTKGGSAENAILLLDEPGLFLHALSQADLLRHLSTDFSNQIIYTTHSPFMVPTEDLDAIRTVNIEQDAGTTVSNNPTGDSRTLFPIQAALGYTISQSLFVGPNNLVVEGVTDFWILTCVSNYLIGNGKPGLPKELTMTPAGGAQKIPYMVSLLTSERLRVLVLFDDEKKARITKGELLQEKVIREDNIVFVTDGFPDAAKPPEADIEDLIEATVYDALVRESYCSELASVKSLTMNTSIPRIEKRYEKAFADVGLTFHKTRPARLFLNKAATDTAAIMTRCTLENFTRLFERISHLHSKNVARGAEPFR